MIGGGGELLEIRADKSKHCLSREEYEWRHRSDWSMNLLESPMIPSSDEYEKLEFDVYRCENAECHNWRSERIGVSMVK